MRSSPLCGLTFALWRGNKERHAALPRGAPVSRRFETGSAGSDQAREIGRTSRGARGRVNAGLLAQLRKRKIPRQQSVVVEHFVSLSAQQYARVEA